jgi:hypothetical protein
MFSPTIAHLVWLAGFRDVGSMISAAVHDEGTLVMPTGEDALPGLDQEVD